MISVCSVGFFGKLRVDCCIMVMYLAHDSQNIKVVTSAVLVAYLRNFDLILYVKCITMSVDGRFMLNL